MTEAKRFCIVICSNQKHPMCGGEHVWFWDGTFKSWLMQTATMYDSRELAEEAATALAMNFPSILGSIAVVPAPKDLKPALEGL